MSVHNIPYLGLEAVVAVCQGHQADQGQADQAGQGQDHQAGQGQDHQADQAGVDQVGVEFAEGSVDQADRTVVLDRKADHADQGQDPADQAQAYQVLLSPVGQVVGSLVGWVRQVGQVRARVGEGLAESPEEQQSPEED